MKQFVTTHLGGGDILYKKRRKEMLPSPADK